MQHLYSPAARAERLIAAGRVAMASASLFAVWLDPTEPSRYAGLAYTLLAAYLAYAVFIVWLVGRTPSPQPAVGIVTHGFDLVFFSVFAYLTLGPGSPFTLYFVFGIVCATLRWHWRGTLWTALFSIATFLALGSLSVSVGGDLELGVTPYLTRAVYLAVIAALLGYLGVHEQSTRREMAQLAAWPSAPAAGGGAVSELLSRAAAVLRCRGAGLVWIDPEEPWVNVAWLEGELVTRREPPDLVARLVAPELAGRSFLSLDVDRPRPAVLWRDGGETGRWTGQPLVRPAVLPALGRDGARALLGHPLRGIVEGWLFFTADRALTSDELVLGDLVRDAVSARLDQHAMAARLRESAADEERVRLARDLHDGALQSFAGIGLSLASARRLLAGDPEAADRRLGDLQRLVASEQRDLRFFIQELRPAPGGAPDPGLGARLGELARRIEQEWGMHVELSAADLDEGLSDDLRRDLYSMVREALVNAVRHGEATRARVELRRDGDGLRLEVEDNGRGFPFSGRYRHEDLERLQVGPRSLHERVSARRGRLDVVSEPGSSRLEIRLPAAEVAA